MEWKNNYWMNQATEMKTYVYYFYTVLAQRVKTT